MGLHCAICKHEWEIPIQLPMKMEIFVRVLRGYTAVGCPKCTATGNNVLLKGD